MELKGVEHCIRKMRHGQHFIVSSLKTYENESYWSSGKPKLVDQVTAKFGVSYKHSSCVNRIISTDDLFVEKSFVYISLSIYLSIHLKCMHLNMCK